MGRHVKLSVFGPPPRDSLVAEEDLKTPKKERKKQTKLLSLYHNTTEKDWSRFDAELSLILFYFRERNKFKQIQRRTKDQKKKKKDGKKGLNHFKKKMTQIKLNKNESYYVHHSHTFYKGTVFQKQCYLEN